MARAAVSQAECVVARVECAVGIWLTIFWMGRLCGWMLVVDDCRSRVGDVRLSYHSCAHDNGAATFAVVRPLKALVDLRAHISSVFHALLAGNGVCATRVDDDRSDSASPPPLQHLLTHHYRRGLELVRREDRGAGTWCLGCYQCQVWESSIRRLDTDVSPRGEESFRIGARSGDIFLLGRRYQAVQRSGVMSSLSQGLGEMCPQGRFDDHCLLVLLDTYDAIGARKRTLKIGYSRCILINARMRGIISKISYQMSRRSPIQLITQRKVGLF